MKKLVLILTLALSFNVNAKDPNPTFCASYAKMAGYTEIFELLITDKYVKENYQSILNSLKFTAAISGVDDIVFGAKEFKKSNCSNLIK